MHHTPAARPMAAPADPSPVRRAAVLAAAGTLGLLAGFGARAGAPLVVLGTAGLRLRGLPEFITPDPGVDLTTLLGAVHAGLVAYAWGLLAAAVARRLAGWRVLAALVVVAALVVLVDPLLPAVLRLGAGAPSRGERVLCALVLAAAAGAGTRLAPPRRAAARVAGPERRRTDRQEGWPAAHDHAAHDHAAHDLARRDDVTGVASDAASVPDRSSHDGPPHDGSPRDRSPHDVAPHDVAPHDVAPHDAPGATPVVRVERPAE